MFFFKLDSKYSHKDVRFFTDIRHVEKKKKTCVLVVCNKLRETLCSFNGFDFCVIKNYKQC